MLVPKSAWCQCPAAHLVDLIHQGLQSVVVEIRLRQDLLVLDARNLYCIYMRAASRPGGKVYNEQLSVEQCDDVACSASAALLRKLCVVLASPHKLNDIVTPGHLKHSTEPQRQGLWSHRGAIIDTIMTGARQGRPHGNAADSDGGFLVGRLGWNVRLLVRRLAPRDRPLQHPPVDSNSKLYARSEYEQSPVAPVLAWQYGAIVVPRDYIVAAVPVIEPLPAVLQSAVDPDLAVRFQDGE